MDQFFHRKQLETNVYFNSCIILLCILCLLWQINKMRAACYTWNYTWNIKQYINELNPLSANSTEWSNTLKQFVGQSNPLTLSVHYKIIHT